MGTYLWPDRVGDALATPYSCFERLTLSKDAGLAGERLLPSDSSCGTWRGGVSALSTVLRRCG